MSVERSPTEQDYIQLAISSTVSNFNGIVCLAIEMVKGGLMSEKGLDFLHSTMMKPLDLPGVANNPLISEQQQRVDVLLSELRSYLADRER